MYGRFHQEWCRYGKRKGECPVVLECKRANVNPWMKSRRWRQPLEPCVYFPFPISSLMLPVSHLPCHTPPHMSLTIALYSV